MNENNSEEKNKKFGYWRKVHEVAEMWSNIFNPEGEHRWMPKVVTYLPGFLFGLFAAPLYGLDEKRILKLEAEKNIEKLIAYIYMNRMGNRLWKKATEALVRLNKDSSSTLTELTKEKPDFKMKQAAVGAPKPIVSTPNLRASAAICLGRMGNKEALPALENMKNDPDETVREYAEAAIKNIKDIN